MSHDHVLHLTDDDWRLEHVHEVTLLVGCTEPACPSVHHRPEECASCLCHEADECPAELDDDADGAEACRRLDHHEPRCCCAGVCDPVDFHGIEHVWLGGEWAVPGGCACSSSWIADELDDDARDILAGGADAVPVSIEYDDVTIVWHLEVRS